MSDYGNKTSAQGELLTTNAVPWGSMVMLIRKCRATVARSLDALLRQKIPGPCEIIFVCDQPDDDSLDVIRSHPLLQQWQAREIFRPGRGVAQANNLGWRAARSNYVFTMHSDCYPVDDDALMRLAGWLEREGSLAVMPLIDIPQGDWEAMSFWDRVTSSQYRHAKPGHGLNGKFDLIRRDALERVGGFDEEHFWSAGEDADLRQRLLSIGKISRSDVVVIHAHVHPPEARFRSALRKHTQGGEGAGALFRKYWRTPTYVRRAWPIMALHGMKLALLVGILIPPISLYAFALLLLLSVYYARWAMLSKDWRVVLVPFAVALMFSFFAVAMVRAFIRGRQSFDYLKQNSTTPAT